MKAPAAGKTEEGLDDLRARLLQAAPSLIEVVGIEDHEGAARRDRIALGEAARQASIGELAIVGAVIGEAPAEGLAVERARERDVADCELDVVDAAIVARFCHRSLQVRY